MGKGLTEDQIKAMTDAQMRQAVGFFGGKLAEMRRKAEYYYLGEAKGDLAPPEVEGRSSFVDTTVRNTILWMKPTLIKTFCGSDNVVEFTPTVEDDEEKAKLATDYINYIFYKQNPGYAIVNTWFDDALLQKVGILKVWWDDRVEESREEYRALDDVALAQLLDDPEVEPIEHASYEDEDAAKQKAQAIEQIQQQIMQAMEPAQQGNPQAAQALQQLQAQLQQIEQQPIPQLHDVTFKRTKKSGKVAIENVPPEEFMIDRKAKSIKEAAFLGHRVLRTISDLTAMGYKNVDQISSDDSALSLNMERVERISWDDDTPYMNTDDVGVDPSMRQVWITECYLRADYNGDGIAEWRKIVRAGNQILENVECDGPPFVSITPIPLAHRFFGLSIADLAMEPQRQSTNLVRAQLDNLYMTVNGRYFAVEGQVNLDDLLTSRPGGIVRVKNPGAVGRLDQGVGDMQGAQIMVQWMQDYTENATGWTRYSQGSSSDSLNKTATGVTTITNRGDMRVDAIARTFAETGFTDLFRLILKLVGQHQDKAISVKLGNKWAQIDPREWRNGFDLNINVGLGTGNKDQQVQHLMMLHQQQGMGLQIGITKPKNMYASAKKLTEALGFKDPDAFWTDPSAPPDPNEPPPPPPAPDPAIVKAQADQQMKQQQLQAEQEKAQLEAQIKQAEIESQERIAQFTAQVESERAERLAQINGEYQLLITREKIAADHEAIVTKAHVDLAQTQAESERTQAEKLETTDKANAPLMEHLQALHEKIDRANRMQTHIVRNPDGTKYAVKVDPEEQGGNT